MSSRETQNLIMDSAIELFNQYGMGAVSVNKVAKVCGISTGNLNYHFRTKPALVQAIYDRYNEERWKTWAADAECDDVAGLFRLFENYIQLAMRYRFLIRELPTIRRHDERLEARSRTHETRRFEAFRNLFVRLVEAGEFDPGVLPELERLLRVSWFVSDSWVPFLEMEGRPLDEQAVTEGFQLAMGPFVPFMTEHGIASIFVRAA
jgi:AcrR family transcriptional regulator